MKNCNLFSMSIFACILLLLSLQSTVYAESINQQFTTHQLQKSTLDSHSKTIQPYLVNLFKELPSWFPGFLLVQLVRGVIALILVLLILFDIIEP